MAQARDPDRDRRSGSGGADPWGRSAREHPCRGSAEDEPLSAFSLTRRARQELADEAARISSDAGDPSASDPLLGRLFKTFELIAASPHLGKPRPELGRGLRSHVVGMHTIFYRPHPHYVEITRVLHQRRDLLQAFASRTRKKLKVTPEFEHFVWERVESGQYATTDDVLTACMDTLAEREIADHDLEWLREQVRRGVEQCERGEYSPGEEAFARIRERLANRRKPPEES